MQRPDERLIATHADNVSAATGAELSNQACELARWVRHIEGRLEAIMDEGLILVRELNTYFELAERMKADTIAEEIIAARRHIHDDYAEEIQASGIITEEPENRAGAVLLKTKRVPDPKGQGYRTETKPDES